MFFLNPQSSSAWIDGVRKRRRVGELIILKRVIIPSNKLPPLINDNYKLKPHYS